MKTSTFFKLFPPPKFLNAPYAGIDISDDAVRCIQFAHVAGEYRVVKYATRPFPAGLVESGHIMDEAKVTAIVADLVRETGISFVKASLPEEKVYLFKTPVPNADSAVITQNIEFKLEENVPLSAADAIFCFEIIPGALADGKPVASVLVSPKKAVETYLDILTSAGLTVISFNMEAQALARSVIETHSTKTEMVVRIMSHKAGVYIVHQGVVCFSSTVAFGDDAMAIDVIRKEAKKVYDYWKDHGEGAKEVDHIVLCGVSKIVTGIGGDVIPLPISVEMGNVWKNIFSPDEYIPPISFGDSLDYAVAAGLAMPTEHFM